jgi:hypothetical protein
MELVSAVDKNADDGGIYAAARMQAKEGAA